MSGFERDEEKYRLFEIWCREHKVTLREAILCAVRMWRPRADKRTGEHVYHSVLECRAFRPEVLTAVFDLNPDGVEWLQEHANDVEHAHKIWTALV